MRYALTDANGVVQNVVRWDGVPAFTVTLADGRTTVVGWSPPPGFAAVKLADSSPAAVGDTLDKSGAVLVAAELPAVKRDPVAVLLDAITSAKTFDDVKTAAAELQADAAAVSDAK